MKADVPAHGNAGDLRLRLRRNGRVLVLESVLVVGATLGPATAQAVGAVNTYTIIGVRRTGDVKAGVSRTGDEDRTDVIIHVGLAPRPLASYATDLAKGLGHGASSAGNKVTIPHKTKGGDLLNNFVQLNSAMVIKTNVDDFVLGHLPAGTLYFASNPISGQDSLDSDATITAGFANGLSTVSFVGSAGETLVDLTSTLNTALRGAGYVTTLVDPLHVEVFADGAVGPTELDFTVTTDGPTIDNDIFYGMESFAAAVPEPGTWALILAGAGISGFLARRRKAVTS